MNVGHFSSTQMSLTEYENLYTGSHDHLSAIIYWIKINLYVLIGTRAVWGSFINILADKPNSASSIQARENVESLRINYNTSPITIRIKMLIIHRLRRHNLKETKSTWRSYFSVNIFNRSVMQITDKR